MRRRRPRNLDRPTRCECKVPPAPHLPRCRPRSRGMNSSVRMRTRTWVGRVCARACRFAFRIHRPCEVDCLPATPLSRAYALLHTRLCPHRKLCSLPSHLCSLSSALARPLLFSTTPTNHNPRYPRVTRSDFDIIGYPSEIHPGAIRMAPSKARTQRSETQLDAAQAAAQHHSMLVSAALATATLDSRSAISPNPSSRMNDDHQNTHESSSTEYTYLHL